MKTIPLTQGRTAMVDDADFDMVSQRKWILRKSRTHDALEYAVSYIPRLNGKQRKLLLHRFILNAPRGRVVDHIDGNGLNCQRSNMRLCTHKENIRNMKMHNKHGFKGVVFIKGNLPHRQWVAAISPNGKRITIGYFPTVIDAARAYNGAAIKHFGEFARINPI